METFSTTEQACGTWVDGSTIYRRSFEVTKSSGTSITLATISGIVPIKAEGWLVSLSGYKYLLNYYESSSFSVGLSMNSSGVFSVSAPNNNYGNGTIYLTLYYIYSD